MVPRVVDIDTRKDLGAMGENALERDNQFRGVYEGAFNKDGGGTDNLDDDEAEIVDEDSCGAGDEEVVVPVALSPDIIANISASSSSKLSVPPPSLLKAPSYTPLN